MMRKGQGRIWHPSGGNNESQRQNRSRGQSNFESKRQPMIDLGRSGNLVCNHNLGSNLCQWRTNSQTSLKLHRADRHLILPDGGELELEKIDPILQEEKRENARRARKKTADDAAEDEANHLIPGLNIQLDTPELIQRWLAERKKRWPTASVIQQKELQSWDEKPKTYSNQKRKENQKRINPNNQSSESASSSESSSEDEIAKERTGNDFEKEGEETDSDSDSSGSDLDPEKDAISSKIPPPSDPRYTEQNDIAQRPLCRFFQSGKCRNGDKCTHRHEKGNSGTLQNNQKKRKRPKAPSPNPFEAPHLLRALLRNEIAQHINSVAQVIRFLVRNNYLEHFEHREGDAAEQSRRRALIRDVGETEESKGKMDLPSDTLLQPITEGALPVANRTLYSPPSPELKPLGQLSLPPEPDEFALMDPLRAHDAKPLTHEQFQQIAQDVGVRSLLVENDGTRGSKSTAKLSKGIVRALSTLDALPSFNHRSSALELILGVSEQSALHSHQVGPTFVRSDRKANTISGQGGMSSKDGPSRVIGETELFRLGLRVGPIEIQKIRQLASRVSNVIGGPTFELEGEEMDADQFRPWLDEKTRNEMRIKQWHKEGEWRDQMRSLGVELD